MSITCPSCHRSTANDKYRLFSKKNQHTDAPLGIGVKDVVNPFFRVLIVVEIKNRVLPSVKIVAKLLNSENQYQLKWEKNGLKSWIRYSLFKRTHHAD